MSTNFDQLHLADFFCSFFFKSNLRSFDENLLNECYAFSFTIIYYSTSIVVRW